MTKLVITAGVDIGGTKTAFGLVDQNKNVLFKNIFPTNSIEGIDNYISRLCGHIKAACAENFKDYLLEGIGIAAPGANHITGTIDAAANLHWGSVNIVEKMSRFFNTPVVLFNDANAAALGELYFGAGKGIDNFVMLTLGTGLGSAIIANKELIKGNWGMAGEFGHIIIKPGGRKCGCGRRGCLETYVSATGISRTAVELLSVENTSSELRKVETSGISAALLSKLALQGDEIALKTYKKTGEILGLFIANTVAALDPEAIILSGGVMKSGELLLEQTRKSYLENKLNISENSVRILQSQFSDGEGAFLGASCLITAVPDKNILVS